jgi:hypothetical protein
MKQCLKLAAAAAVGACAAVSIGYAQPAAAPPEAVVTIYRAAPGQQEALLRWLADQDRVAAAAGQRPGQIYIHTDGDSWDFVGITPMASRTQSDALDAAAKKMGMATGARRALEFRKLISSHTDTYAIGPVTAAQAVAMIGS